jgi:transcriptional regulator with XRE-family HTH domain
MSAPSSSAAPLATRIRQERLRLGWTQADLASRAGVALNTYERFERSAEISLGRLLKVAAAVGLDLTFATPGEVTPSASLSDPRLLHVRQRGLRHARPAPEPSRTAKTPSSDPQPTPATPRPPAPPPVQPKPSVDPSAVAEVAKQYRDPIRLLVRTIVLNQLNNYTTRTVVENTMRSKNVDVATQPAFVAAVEGELAKLNGQTCALLEINASEYENWAKTWDTNLGVVGVFE